MSNAKRARMTRAEVAGLADTWARVEAIMSLAEATAAEPGPDLLDRVIASACHAADICLMSADCPFVADCRKVEGTDGGE